MTDEIRPFGQESGGSEPLLAFHGRVYVLRPGGAIGKLALAAVIVAAGVLFFTVGLALVATLAAAAVVTGLGLTVSRALGGRGGAAIAPPPLDPAKEIRLRKPEG